MDCHEDEHWRSERGRQPEAVVAAAHEKDGGRHDQLSGCNAEEEVQFVCSLNEAVKLMRNLLSI